MDHSRDSQEGIIHNTIYGTRWVDEYIKKKHILPDDATYLEARRKSISVTPVYAPKCDEEMNSNKLEIL